MRIPMSIELKMGESLIQLEKEVPAWPADLQGLLPVFRSITDDLVNIAVGQASADNKTISCKAGCGACCRMAVPVAEPEAFRLRDVVDAMPEPRRSRVQARFAEAMDVFRDTGLLQDMFQSPRTEEDITKIMADLHAYYAKGQACPFLEEESCSIYEERPLICRQFLVTSPAKNCSNIKGEGVERLPVPARPSRVLIALASQQKESREAVLPLIQVLEWTSENRDLSEERFAPEWVAEFGAGLQAKVDEALESEAV